MRQRVPVGWTIPEEGAYIIASTIGIAKETKHKELAYRYINFILDPETQAAHASHILISPAVEGLRWIRAFTKNTSALRRMISTSF